MPDAVCNLHTGYQSAGKTLMSLAHVEALRLSSGRKVFYSGIRELTLDWQEFGGASPDPERPWLTDPSEWFKLETGAIIVIDEAQRLFRPRGNGSAVPPYEAALETLRHNGHTLFLITQHPSLISTGTRRLCGVHRHFMRKLNTRWVTVHEWVGVRDNCDKTRKDSISTDTTYPKEFYDKYRSSEEHNVRVRVPLKLLLMALVPLAAIVLFWWMLWGRNMRDAPRPTEPGSPVQSSGQQITGSGGGLPGQRVKRHMTDRDFVIESRPRIEGLPHTAPRYDELTAPVRVPIVVGCWMQGQTGGYCITQQGSRVSLPRPVMAQFIERGQFVDFEPGPELGAQSDKPAAGAGKHVQSSAQ